MFHLNVLLGNKRNIKGFKNSPNPHCSRSFEVGYMLSEVATTCGIGVA